MNFISESNINLSSRVNISNNKYLELRSFIENLIMEDFLITPNEIYDNIIKNLWKDLDLQLNITNKYPISYSEAYSIDQSYSRKGGNFWLDAFGRPVENSVFEHDSQKYIAKDCGIFTFKLVLFDEQDNKMNNFAQSDSED